MPAPHAPDFMNDDQDRDDWRPTRRDSPSNDAPPGADELTHQRRAPVRGTGPSHSSRPASTRHSDPGLPDFARYGYAGQHYPVYGRPSGLDPHPRSQEPQHRHDQLHSREPHRFSEWHADAGAYASGFTPPLHPDEPFPRYAREPHGRGDVSRGDVSRGHAGKGPKGYVRSDARIREDVCDRLSDDDEIDASDISVSVTDGEVLLEGQVSDRHDKRRAEDVAWSVRGVAEVHNELGVKKSFFRELGDKLKGQDTEHHGHYGSGTRNQPAP